MRTLYFLITFVLLPITLCAQRPPIDYPVAAQARTTSFTPTICRFHLPSSNGLDTLYQDLNTWNNNLLSNSTREVYNAGVWDPQTRHYYAYDSGDRQIMDSVQIWNGSAWENNSIMTNQYDNNGNLLNTTNFFWSGSSWDTLLSFSYDYTFHSSGEWEVQTLNAWQNGVGYSPSSRTTNYFNSTTQEIDSVTFDSWNGTVWTVTGKFLNITWYDFPNRLYGSYLFQPHSGGQPQSLVRQTLIYTNPLNYIWYIEQQNGTQYDSISHTVQEADANDNITLIEQFSYTTSPPNQSFGEQYLLTYNGSNLLTEAISQEYNTASGMYESVQVAQYFYGAVGRPEPEANQLHATLFPNPSTGLVQLRFENERPGTLHIQVYDLQGQKILQSAQRQPLGISQSTLSLEELDSGTYLIHLRMGNQTSTQRIYIH